MSARCKNFAASSGQSGDERKERKNSFSVCSGSNGDGPSPRHEVETAVHPKSTTRSSITLNAAWSAPFGGLGAQHVVLPEGASLRVPDSFDYEDLLENLFRNRS